MTVTYKGVVFRAHKPHHASSPSSGEGASYYGGRFNPKGVAALYTSIEETTALAEHQQGFLHRPQPTTLCAYNVDCEDILDLTNPGIRQQYKIKIMDLACPWEDLIDKKAIPPSWRITKKLIGEDIAGIIVPSFAKNAPKDGKNIVFWHWGKTHPHRVIVIDDEYRLPKDMNSWQDK